MDNQVRNNYWLGLGRGFVELGRSVGDGDERDPDQIWIGFGLMW